MGMHEHRSRKGVSVYVGVHWGCQRGAVTDLKLSRWSPACLQDSRRDLRTRSSQGWTWKSWKSREVLFSASLPRPSGARDHLGQALFRETSPILFLKGWGSRQPRRELPLAGYSREDLGELGKSGRAQGFSLGLRPTPAVAEPLVHECPWPP